MRVKSKIHLLLVICVLFIAGIQNCLAAHTLRVGIRLFPENKKWVLIGISSQHSPFASDLNFEQLGFHGKDMDHIDPKFILEMKSDRITRVRSFEIEESLLEDDDPIEAKRPPTLLNTDHARRSEVQHFIGNTFSALGKTLGFPIATGTVVGRIHAKHSESLRKLNSFYLLELINKTLAPFNLFPELKTAISENPEIAELGLRNLGEALLIRYNPHSNLAGISARDEENGGFFEKWRQFQSGFRVQNQGYLNRLSNELGLKILPIGPDFAILLIDTLSQKNKNGLQSELKENRYPHFVNLSKIDDESQRFLRGSSKDSLDNPLLPWSVISYIHSEGPIEVLNFSSPGDHGKKLKELAHWEMAQNLGGSIIPLSNLVIKGIVKTARSFSLSMGNTQYLNQLQSYAALLALTETRAYHIHHMDGISEKWLQDSINLIKPGFPVHLKRFSKTFHQIVYLIGLEETKLARVFSPLTLDGFHKMKAQRLAELRTWIHQNEASNSKASRSPSSLSNIFKEEPLPSRKPVIVFMIDGLRPDRFKIAAEEGYLPNLKSLFIDRGVHLESYASRALTVPSWSTILTGFENDVNGIRSNTPTSRIAQKTTDNFLDPMTDLLKIKYISKSRSFYRLEENQTGIDGKVWLPDYFHKDQTLYNFLPVVKGAHYAFKEIFGSLPSQLSELFNHVWNPPSSLDYSSAITTAKAISKDKEGKLRIVLNWYASADEAQHYNNRLLPTVYREIDQGIGEILKAAQDHPYLRNATVFLVSDHGHTGGFGPFDQTNAFYQSKHSVASTIGGPLMVHTGFNLTQFFSGKFKGYEDYNFNVVASTFPKKKYHFTSLEQVKVGKPVHSKPKKSSKTEVLVDYSGDNLAHVYLRGNTDWKRRHNFYEITHFPSHTKKRELNIPADLFNIRLENLSVTHKGLKKRIIELTDFHPVELLAMALPGKEAKDSADALYTVPGTPPSTREPVLVMSKRKNSDQYRYGIILTLSNPNGTDQFRYVVLKNFKQNPNGQIVGTDSLLPTISTDPADDPLEYLAHIPLEIPLDTWKTDREWLTLTHLHPKPTAVFTLSRALTLSPKFTDPANNLVSEDVKTHRQAEIPDFLVISNFGYAFHSETPEESDHGGLAREEVRNSFFVSSMNRASFTPHKEVNRLILTRDFMATILNYSGLGDPGNDPLPKTQGMSFKQWIDAEIR